MAAVIDDESHAAVETSLLTADGQEEVTVKKADDADDTALDVNGEKAENGKTVSETVNSLDVNDTEPVDNGVEQGEIQDCSKTDVQNGDPAQERSFESSDNDNEIDKILNGDNTNDEPTDNADNHEAEDEENPEEPKVEEETERINEEENEEETEKINEEENDEQDEESDEEEKDEEHKESDEEEEEEVDDEDMSDLFSAYKNVLDADTADDSSEPLHTSVVDHMDTICENEEAELAGTMSLPTVKRFTGSGGSVNDEDEAASSSAGFSRSWNDSSANNSLGKSAVLMKVHVGAGKSSLEGLHSVVHDQDCESRSGTSDGTSSARPKDGSITASECDQGQQEEPKAKPVEKIYPDFIQEFSTRLKQHYVSTYAKETPLDWFKSEKKPSHRIFTEFWLTSTQKLGTITQRLDDVVFRQGDRVCIIGDSGYGKTCLTHRILHDYGLGLLPSCTKYKILLALDVTLWSCDQSVDDVIKEQILKERMEVGEEVYTWIHENSEDILFVIDGIDRHFETDGHPILDLAEGKLYSYSTVLFLSRPHGSAAIREHCQVIHYMDKLTDRQIDEFVERFFESDESIAKSVTGKFDDENRGLYRIPLNLSLLCRLAENSVIEIDDAFPNSQTELFDRLFLHSLRKLNSDTSCPIDELASLLTNLALRSIENQDFSLTEKTLEDNYKIPGDLREHLVENGILTKVPLKDLYYFPYRLYQEFLAAKYIAIKYFKASNSDQIGICDKNAKRELEELFDKCWSCENPEYRFDKICVFLSGLLRKDYDQLVQSMADHYGQLRSPQHRQRCEQVAFACIRENSQNRAFVSILSDCISQNHTIEMSNENNSNIMQGLISMLKADKVTSLSLKKCARDLGLPLLCDSMRNSDRLTNLKVDFTDFDQHPSLKILVKGISGCQSLKNLTLVLYIDEMSLESTEAISGLFLNLSADLKSMGVHLLFTEASTYYEDRPTVRENLDVFERVNIFVSRMTVFLQNHPGIEHLDLNGCFLHKDALPELRDAIMSHPNLRSLEIAGQNKGAPLHREGVVALSDILSTKKFEDITIDLNSFNGHLAESMSRSGKKWVRFEGYTSELITTRLLKAMQQNANLRKVRFTCHGVDSDLSDLVADFIESCEALKHVEFECDDFDDLLLLFVGCGILCSFSVETLTLKGAFRSGAALLQLLQNSLISISMKEVVLECKPITKTCIEWLVENFPEVHIEAGHPVRLLMKGDVVDDYEQGSVDKVIEELSECALPLDLLLENELRG